MQSFWFSLQLHSPVSESMLRNDNLSSYQKILLLLHQRLLLVFPLELHQMAIILFPRFSTLFPGIKKASYYFALYLLILNPKTTNLDNSISNGVTCDQASFLGRSFFPCTPPHKKGTQVSHGVLVTLLYIKQCKHVADQTQSLPL